MLDLQLLVPSITVAYAMWATPGPNNMMLMYSGARFGALATLPHVLGIVLGTVLLNGCAILGLKPLIDQWPMLLWLLKVVGSFWLVWIGIKMIRAHQVKKDAKLDKPMAFWAAVAFQFANPKAITATLALVSLILVALEKQSDLVWAILIIFPLLSFVAIMPWMLAGRVIGRWLSTPTRWMVFSWLTGLLTAGCALFLWI